MPFCGAQLNHPEDSHMIGLPPITGIALQANLRWNHHASFASF